VSAIYSYNVVAINIRIFSGKVAQGILSSGRRAIVDWNIMRWQILLRIDLHAMSCLLQCWAHCAGIFSFPFFLPSESDWLG